MTDLARGDPRLDRFYNNTTPDAATPLITQFGSTRPACRDKRTFTKARTSSQTVTATDVNRWKRLLETTDGNDLASAAIAFFVRFVLKSSTTPVISVAPENPRLGRFYSNPAQIRRPRRKVQVVEMDALS